MNLLATLIAKREGFGIPGALPTRANNPGDLRHAPGEMHAPDAPDSVGSFDSVDAGWAALNRQLQLYAARGLTLRQAIYMFAPPSENDSAEYLAFVCAGLGGVSPDLPMTDALTYVVPDSAPTDSAPTAAT